MALQRLFNIAWANYRRFLGIATVGTVLGAIWAAFGSNTWYLRLLPLASLLMIFIACLLWAAWSYSLRRELVLAKQVKILEYSRDLTYSIDANGNLDMLRKLTIRNRGARAINSIFDERIGFELTDLSDSWVPELRILSTPAGKEISEIYHFQYDLDRHLTPESSGQTRVICWGIQVKPILEPGEDVAVEYSVPTLPETEKPAFSEKGSYFTLTPERLYSRIHYSVHGPVGYRFEIDELKVYGPRAGLYGPGGGSRERLEEKWCRAFSNPAVDKKDSSLLKWEIQWPIPGYTYTLNYKLKRIGS